MIETPTLRTQQIERLRRQANEIRRRDLRMIYEAGMGHIGGDLSATDILTTLYFGVLKVNPSDPDDPEPGSFHNE